MTTYVYLAENTKFLAKSMTNDGALESWHQGEHVFGYLAGDRNNYKNNNLVQGKQTVSKYTELLELPLETKPRTAGSWSLSGFTSTISPSSAAALTSVSALGSPVCPGLASTDALPRSAWSLTHAPTSVVAAPHRALAAIVAPPRLTLSRPMCSPPPHLQSPRRCRSALSCRRVGRCYSPALPHLHGIVA